MRYNHGINSQNSQHSAVQRLCMVNTHFLRNSIRFQVWCATKTVLLSAASVFWFVTLACTTRLIHVCEVYDLCVRVDSFICNDRFVKRRQHLWVRDSLLCTIYSCKCANFLIHTSNMYHIFFEDRFVKRHKRIWGGYD